MAEDKLKKPHYPDVHLYKAVAQDQRLSLEARGLYAMMMSLPDNWDYSVGGLATVAGCGKDKIRRLLDQLEEVGYLLREQQRKGGKFCGNVYVLQSYAPPSSGNTDNGNSRRRQTPPTRKTVDGKPDTNYISNKENNTPIPPKGDEGEKKKKRKSKYALADDAKPILRAYVGEGEGMDRELAKALADFVELRETLRAVNSAKAIKELLRRLDELSRKDRELKLLLIRQSIANSWKSVFPLKGVQQPAPVHTPAPSAPRRSHVEIIDGEEVTVFDQ